MTRAEIITMFRGDNPDIPERVVGNTELHNWCKIGDKEICAETRCIITDFTFNSVASSTVYTARHDLVAEESKFFDIDTLYGGGVIFDDDHLEETSPAKLDEDNPNWRDRTAGTPEKWYRRGKWLYFDTPILTADLEIRVYASLISDDFDNDGKSPFNEITFLEPYHYALVLYLQKKAKMKAGKPGEEIKAQREYNDYIKWMKRMLTGGKAVPILYRPVESLYQNSYSSRR